MKSIGDVYLWGEKTIIVDSFCGKDQAVALCYLAEKKFSTNSTGCFEYTPVGKKFELAKEELDTAVKANSYCDNCAFYRTSMYNGEFNRSRAWCAYRRTMRSTERFAVDCVKFKGKNEIQKEELSAKKAKAVLHCFFKDCRFVCGSDIQTKNSDVKIEYVSDFFGMISERLISQKHFDALLKDAFGKVTVIQNFSTLLDPHQIKGYLSGYTQLNAYQIDANALDYDVYVYFCSEFPDTAFLFEDLGVGVFTLHELTVKVTL